MSAAATRARAAAPTAGGHEATVLVVPPQPEGTIKSWRRLVTGTDPTRGNGAYAVQGQFLDAGVAYQMPLGAVVLVVDQYPDRWSVVMAHAGVGELKTAKEWELKARLGKRVVDFVARRLPAGAGGHRAIRLELEPNLFDGRCMACRQDVAARAGRLVRESSRVRVAHLQGTCPPPPPPPPVVEPNRRGEECMLCGGWVQAGEGVALLRTSRDEVTGARYQAAHKGGCPPDTVPGPPNQVSGWCVECRELVPPEKGYWLDHELRHRSVCPEPVTNGPTWIVRRPRREDPFTVGQVRRVRLDLRGGIARVSPPHVIGEVLYRRPEQPEVPPGVAGYRVLSETYVELVGVVLECVAGRRGRQRARMRAATPAEATDLLAGETGMVVSARPDAGSFKARFSATKIAGVRPWLAEITGRDPDYRYRREFLGPQVDYTHSNRSGTDGAEYGWVLRPNAVYETGYAESRRSMRREFLRATPDGDVVEISEEEVEAWLNAAPAWPAH